VPSHCSAANNSAAVEMASLRAVGSTQACPMATVQRQRPPLLQQQQLQQQPQPPPQPQPQRPSSHRQLHAQQQPAVTLPTSSFGSIATPRETWQPPGRHRSLPCAAHHSSAQQLPTDGRRLEAQILRASPHVWPVRGSGSSTPSAPPNTVFVANGSHRPEGDLSPRRCRQGPLISPRSSWHPTPHQLDGVQRSSSASAAVGRSGNATSAVDIAVSGDRAQSTLVSHQVAVTPPVPFQSPRASHDVALQAITAQAVANHVLQGCDISSEEEEEGAWVSPAAVAVLVSRLLKLRKTAATQSWVQAAFAAWAGAATFSEHRSARPAITWAVAACGRVQDVAATRHCFDTWQRYVTLAAIDPERRRFVRCSPAMQAKAAALCQRCTERIGWPGSLADSGQLNEDGTLQDHSLEVILRGMQEEDVQNTSLEGLLHGMQEASRPGWESPSRCRSSPPAQAPDRHAEADGQSQRELAAKLEAMQSRATSWASRIARSVSALRESATLHCCLWAWLRASGKETLAQHLGARYGEVQLLHAELRAETSRSAALEVEMQRVAESQEVQSETSAQHGALAESTRCAEWARMAEETQRRAAELVQEAQQMSFNCQRRAVEAEQNSRDLRMQLQAAEVAHNDMQLRLQEAEKSIEAVPAKTTSMRHSSPAARWMRISVPQPTVNHGAVLGCCTRCWTCSLLSRLIFLQWRLSSSSLPLEAEGYVRLRALWRHVGQLRQAFVIWWRCTRCSELLNWRERGLALLRVIFTGWCLIASSPPPAATGTGSSAAMSQLGSMAKSAATLHGHRRSKSPASDGGPSLGQHRRRTQPAMGSAQLDETNHPVSSPRNAAQQFGRKVGDTLPRSSSSGNSRGSCARGRHTLGSEVHCHATSSSRSLASKSSEALRSETHCNATFGSRSLALKPSGVTFAGSAAATVSLTLSEVEEPPLVHTRVNILDLQKECSDRRSGFAGPTTSAAMLATPQRQGTRSGAGAATG